ncbi:unnamed protein product [Prorocentrum cordatum]|uniref:Uncharacterized protein n=1 Tax=Prorocentrum cordatum TaxID=2364126 RepID=A0ABN9TTR9_9DINO|nr:unnamed protein product [Polarella glacialis]
MDRAGASAWAPGPGASGRIAARLEGSGLELAWTEERGRVLKADRDFPMGAVVLSEQPLLGARLLPSCPACAWLAGLEGQGLLECPVLSSSWV